MNQEGEAHISFNRTEELLCLLSVQPLPATWCWRTRGRMFNSAAPPTTCIITSTHFLTPRWAGAALHSLTHPDVQSQCVTAVLPELGEDFLSESPALHHAVCTQTSFEGLNFIYSFSDYYNPLPSSLTLGVGAQVDFHAGLHLIFSRGHWQRSKAAVGRGARAKGIGNRHFQRVKHSTRRASPLGCRFSSLPLHSGNSALACLHSWFACTRPLQKVQNAHLKSKNNRKKIIMHVNQI